METNTKTSSINKKIIDLSYLKQLSNGDNNFIKEMIEVFMVQTPEAMDNLQKHLLNNDWKMVRAVAHKIKPSMAFVGLNDIQKKMNTVEEYAETETHLDELPEMIEEIKVVIDRAMKELKEEMKAYA
jgi:HPt (histidine-containing phosphotransfer) domain-containing protein